MKPAHGPAAGRVWLLVFAGCSLALQAAMPPEPPATPSPVETFRQLLSTNAEAREQLMRRWSGPRREVLEAKIHEYQGMSEAERELRLQATELRFYLRPLLEAPADERAARLELIPERVRPIVTQRLAAWDALPDSLRGEFLSFDRAAARAASAPPRTLSPGQRDLEADQQLSRWQALPMAQREETCRQFELFFNLSPRQRERILGELTEEERHQMQHALDAFSQMPPAQRRLCLASFQKLAELSPRERARFLGTVDRWRELTPAERQRWRLLVTKLPPTPPGFNERTPPPLPPSPPAAQRLATNGSP